MSDSESEVTELSTLDKHKHVAPKQNQKDKVRRKAFVKIGYKSWTKTIHENIFKLVKEKEHTTLKDWLDKNKGTSALRECLLTKDEAGNSLFHVSCHQEDVVTAQMLLKAAEDEKVLPELMSIENKRKLTAFDMACHCLSDSLDISYVVCKLKSNKKLFRDIIFKRSSDGQMILHYACFLSTQLALSLIKSVDGQMILEMLTSTNNRGTTPLQMACVKNNTEVVSAILDILKAQPEILQKVLMFQNEAGNLLLHVACEFRCVAIVQMILDAADITVVQNMLTTVNALNLTPLQMAYSTGLTILETTLSAVLQTFKNDPKILESILTFCPKDGETLLHHACSRKCTDVVKVILATAGRELGVRLISQTTKKNENVLHRAISTLGNFQVVSELLRHLKDDIQSLNEIIQQQDDAGNTVFHIVCLYGFSKTAYYIWESCTQEVRMALLQTANNDRESCLHILCSSGMNSVAILKIVLKDLPKERYREVLSLQNSSRKQTCLHNAFISGNVGAIEALLQNVETNEISELLALGDLNGQTCIHAACQAGQQASLVTLLSLENINIVEECFTLFESTDENKQTPLHLACLTEHASELLAVFANVFSPYQLRHLLLMKDRRGNMPLHAACYSGNITAIKLLLEACRQFMAEVLRETNQDGDTLLHIASTNSATISSILQLLSRLPLADEDFKSILSASNRLDETVLYLWVKHKSAPSLLLLELLEVNHCLEYFLGQKYENDNSFLLVLFTDALEQNDVALVRLLLNNASLELLTAENSFQLFTSLIKCTCCACKELVFEYAKTVDNITMTAHRVAKKVSHTRFDGVRLLHDVEKKHPRLDILELIRGTPLEEETYILNYLYEYWSSAKLLKFIFWFTFTMYVLLVLFLSLYVTDHTYHIDTLSQNDTSNLNATSNVVKTKLVFEVGLTAEVSSYLLLTFACFTFVFDCLFTLNIHKKELSRILQNSFNTVVSLCCIVLFVAKCCQRYSQWQHGLGICTIILAYFRLALSITTLPSFIHSPRGKLRKNISKKFLLTFRVMFEVLKFMPIFLLFLFLFMFSVCFISLFQVPKQPVFDRLGYATVKSLAMAIGELDLSDLVMTEETAAFPFHAFTCMLLVGFMLVMTISIMNLLIGIALNELQKLQKESGSQAFRNFVCVLEEVQYIIDLRPIK